MDPENQDLPRSVDDDRQDLPDDDSQDLPRSVVADRRPWRSIAFILIGLVVASGIVLAVYQITKSDDSGDAAQAAPTDTGVSIPQVPSLRIFVEEGTHYVGNDGNVTMHDVDVRDAAGATVCELGVISPGDRQPCEAAADAVAPVAAVGSGPQGQPVETLLE